jgi:arabinogalactan endo-1,4-beta-galactosidase
MKPKVFLLSLISFVTLFSCSPSSSQASSSSLSNVLESKYELTDYDPSFKKEEYAIEKIPALENKKDFINAIDISMEDCIEEQGGKYYDEEKKEQDFFSILKDHNVNAVRLRLFHDYTSPIGIKGAGKQNKERVLKMARRAKEQGMKFILDLHYSDTWADPGSQQTPYAFKDLDFEGLIQEVYQYTKKTAEYFNSNGAFINYIQIGNEINNGMMWPLGKIDWTDQTSQDTSFAKLASLIKSGVRAVRNASPLTKVILHIANGLENTNASKTPSSGIAFFNQMEKNNVDYDIMASSFYPYWTKTKIDTISTSITQLTRRFRRPFILMEYAFGYTTMYNENAKNILTTGLSQNTDYSLSIQGQTDCMRDIIAAAAEGENSIGASYWGGEWIPVIGAGSGDENSKDSWANQALFTYEGVALPSLSVFKKIY